jgi:hypothetical protein
MFKFKVSGSDRDPNCRCDTAHTIRKRASCPYWQEIKAAKKAENEADRAWWKAEKKKKAAEMRAARKAAAEREKRFDNWQRPASWLLKAQGNFKVAFISYLKAVERGSDSALPLQSASDLFRVMRIRELELNNKEVVPVPVPSVALMNRVFCWLTGEPVPSAPVPAPVPRRPRGRPPLPPKPEEKRVKFARCPRRRNPVWKGSFKKTVLGKTLRVCPFKGLVRRETWYTDRYIKSRLAQYRTGKLTPLALSQETVAVARRALRSCLAAPRVAFALKKRV